LNSLKQNDSDKPFHVSSKNYFETQIVILCFRLDDNDQTNDMVLSSLQ
jgi:hypothetical protein